MRDLRGPGSENDSPASLEPEQALGPSRHTREFVEEEPTAVAVLGTGLLGGAVASKLASSGRNVVAWNRTRRKAEALGPEVEVVDTPAEAARRSHLIVLCLADGPAIEGVLSGPEGALSVVGATLFCDLSTVGPEWAQRLETLVTGAGAGYVAAPVIGSGSAARSGELVVLAGGEKEAVDTVASVLRPTYKKLFRLGGVAQAAAAKLAVNTLLGLVNEAIAEAFALGVSSGLDPRLVLDILEETPAGSQVRKKRPLVESVDYEPSFKIELLAKDLELAHDMAERCSVAARCRGLKATLDNVKAALDAGLGGLDYSVMASYVAGSVVPPSVVPPQDATL